MKSQRAFSLLEVVVTLALFSFVIITLLGFFPIAQRSSADAVALTEAPLIAESIISLLQATKPQGIIATGPDWMTLPSHSLHFSLHTKSHHYVAYNDRGEPQQTVTLQEYEHAIKKQNIKTLAAISISPDTQLPGIIRVDIEITIPAHLSIKQRHRSQFTFYYFPKRAEL